MINREGAEKGTEEGRGERGREEVGGRADYKGEYAGENREY